MRRFFFYLALPFVAFIAFSQEPDAGPPNPFHVVRLLERHQASLELLTSGLRRDAYVVSQLVSAVADLNDFQQSAAMQKAIDRVDAARKRASEKPVAPKPTLELLDSVRDLLGEARERGSMADRSLVQKQVLKESELLQQQLFRDLQEVREQREQLGELQMLIVRMSDDTDRAMSEALSSTFDFIRAGGK